MANTLAYYDTATNTAVKSFIVQAHYVICRYAECRGALHLFKVQKIVTFLVILVLLKNILIWCSNGLICCLAYLVFIEINFVTNKS